MARVTLVLAHAPDLPEGCTDDRIEMRVCLTPQGRLDARAKEVAPEPWPVVRARPGRPTRQGELVPLENDWALRGLDGDDAPIRRIAPGVLRPGEILELGEPDGTRLLYRVVAVDAD